MNFKPTLLKSIFSLLSGVIVNYIFAGTVQVSCLCEKGVLCNCLQPKWIEHSFDSGALLFTIFGILLVYVVWSFIQKK